MSLASKISLSVAGLAVAGLGTMLWVKFGTLVYFDVVAASFIGCFF